MSDESPLAGGRCTALSFSLLAVQRTGTVVRHGGGTTEDGLQIWQPSLDLLAHHEEVDMAAALTLSVQYGISIYDAQYVSLAMNKQVHLITEDQKLLSIVPKYTCAMANFTKII